MVTGASGQSRWVANLVAVLRKKRAEVPSLEKLQQGGLASLLHSNEELVAGGSTDPILADLTAVLHSVTGFLERVCTAALAASEQCEFWMLWVLQLLELLEPDANASQMLTEEHPDIEQDSYGEAGGEEALMGQRKRGTEAAANWMAAAGMPPPERALSSQSTLGDLSLELGNDPLDFARVNQNLPTLSPATRRSRKRAGGEADPVLAYRKLGLPGPG